MKKAVWLVKKIITFFSTKATFYTSYDRKKRNCIEKKKLRLQTYVVTKRNFDNTKHPYVKWLNNS